MRSWRCSRFILEEEFVDVLPEKQISKMKNRLVFTQEFAIL